MGLPARKLWVPERRLKLYSEADLKMLPIRKHPRFLPDDRQRILPYNPLHNAISIVQHTSGQNALSSSLSATWANPNTLQGSTLFAVFGLAGAVTGTITFPASWQTGGGQTNTELVGSPWQNGTASTLRVVVLTNANPQSGNIAFTLPSTVQGSGLVLIEVSGLGVLDGTSSGTNPTAINTGTSTGASTNSLTPNGATNLAFGFFAAGSASVGAATTTFSAPTVGAILDQNGNHHATSPIGRGAVCVVTVSNPSGGNIGVTLSQSDGWIGIRADYIPFIQINNRLPSVRGLAASVATTPVLVGR